jgi:hypothetical protein
MTAAERMKLIADADARRRRAERATLHAEIRLAIVRERIAALETAEARRQKHLIQTAVKRVVKSGDYAGEFAMTEQFIADPTLISLATAKRCYRAGGGL